MRAHRFWIAVTVAAFMTMIGVALIPSWGGSANDRTGQITVPQSALNSLIGEPDRHFHRAADLYVQGDADGAASAIRAAAALIHIEAGRGRRPGLSQAAGGSD